MNRYLLMYIFILVVIATTSSCGNSLQGRHGFSSTLEESKNRGVFLYEIEADSVIVINDTLSIPIKNCWIEKDWAYGSSDIEETRLKNGEQLIIDTGKKNCLKTYLVDWVVYYQPLGADEQSLGSINNKIFTLFEPKRTRILNFSVLCDWGLIKNQDDYNNRLLGKFILKAPEQISKE